MNRGSLLWLGSIALLLLFAAWWFTVISAAAGIFALLAPVVAPAVMVIASSILFWAGWRKEISGVFMLASVLLGIGLVGCAQWFAVSTVPWQAPWLLLPAFGGAGILIVNHLGFGWRFSDRLAIILIVASLVFFLAALAWTGQASAADSAFRPDPGFRSPFNAALIKQIRIPEITFSVWR